MSTYILAGVLGIIVVAAFHFSMSYARKWCVSRFKKQYGDIIRMSYLPKTRLFTVATQNGDFWTCRGTPGAEAYGFYRLGYGKMEPLDKIAVRTLVLYQPELWNHVKERTPYQFPENVVELKRQK